MADEIKRDTVDYRDPTPFDNTKLNSLSEISKALRHKTYGEDTREAIAQQGEALAKLMQEMGGNQSAEVAAARGNFELLGIREDAQDNAIDVINANKADKTETDAKLSVKRNTATKIKRADMDTSNDGAKLGLINLSEEVQAAIAGKAPVIGSVENGSITEQKIAAGAITGDKLVQSVLSGYSLLVGGELPNYDQSTKTFTFGNSNKLAIIAWGSIHRFQIPKGLKIINTPENDYTATRLMFNTESLSFRFISWDNNYEPAEICIMSVRADWGGELGKPLISANFPVLINGDYPSDHDRWAKIVPSPTFKPDYNDSTHVFDFNSQKRLTLKNSYEPKVFLLLKDSKGVVMEDNVTVINTVAESGASTYARLIYSESDNSFKFQRIDAPLKFNDYTIAIIRDNSTDKNASTRQAIITSPSEITINGLPNSTYEEDTYANVIAINHRGASDFAPENTMPAFKMSKKLGFKYVETDIHFTSDNIPVLIHDETINRTAVNADGTAITDTIKVADNTLATLNMYDYSLIEKRRVDAYIGTKMATLEDLLKYGKRANLKLVLELKIDLSDAQIDTVMGLVWKYGMQRNIIWQSFEASRFNHLKALDPKAKLGFLFSKVPTADDNLAKMLPYRNDTNEIIASVQAGSNRDDFYKYSKNDIRVFVWTFYADGAVLDWGVNTAVSGIMTQGDIQQGYILSRQ